MVTLVGAQPIILQTQESDGYLITPQALRSTLQQAEAQGLVVKLLILCNPSNPTGGVHNRQQLEQLAQVLEDYPQVYVLAMKFTNDWSMQIPIKINMLALPHFPPPCLHGP
jgi:aspartate/methionine/tyrosine aminotransferase